MSWEGVISSTATLPLVGLGFSVAVVIVEGAADAAAGDDDGSDGRGVVFWVRWS